MFAVLYICARYAFYGFIRRALDRETVFVWGRNSRHKFCICFQHSTILACYHTCTPSYSHAIMFACYHTCVLSCLLKIILAYHHPLYYHACLPSYLHTAMLRVLSHLRTIILAYSHTCIPFFANKRGKGGFPSHASVLRKSYREGICWLGKKPSQGLVCSSAP